MEIKNNIPQIGFGTWKLPNDEESIETIINAVKCGYRLIDTAYAYNNEETIGKSIEKLDIKREELFVQGKLWNADRGYENIINACKRTIENLKCEYLDMYLIHWPASPALYENWKEINKETWKAFEFLQKEGLVKNIGVCNFKKHQLESLMENCNVKPAVNQIEFHPGFMQNETTEYCKENEIVVEAWSPLGSGKMLKREALKEIANKYNVSVAKLCLRWCAQNNVIPISKSTKIENMMENLSIFDFEIKDEDMKKINEMPYMGGSGLDSDTLTLFN